MGTKRTLSKTFWLGRLRCFIEHHPWLPAEEEVFVPLSDLKVGLFFEGGVHLVGDHSTLQINFNDPTLIIICHTKSSVERIYRFPWARFIGFELIPSRHAPEPEVQRFFLN
jgi:hypothetical protein